ncbi:uncharacterized protein Lolal isoform X2 [Anoplolepis gracilipes]|uniref:uncharacterized protein Lolal isoform X2 n=1 Tax=Anoplolepis gracilipes TaxID=354296 RepID=UPI003B9F3E74
MQIGTLRPTEIVRVRALRRAALNDTNGVRTSAHDAEWEAFSVSVALSISHMVTTLYTTTPPLHIVPQINGFEFFFERDVIHQLINEISR